MPDIRARLSSLRRQIEEHNRRYYDEARPTISDAAYDALFRELKTLEEAHPDLVTPDSPTQRVGAEAQSELAMAVHTAPMLSLDSSQAEADVRRFDERVRKAVDGKVAYLLEPKLDGA